MFYFLLFVIKNNKETNELYFLKDKNIILIINKFNITFYFLMSHALINRMLYLANEVFFFYNAKKVIIYVTFI